MHGSQHTGSTAAVMLPPLHQTSTLNVHPGRHSIKSMNGWCRSQQVKIVGGLSCTAGSTAAGCEVHSTHEPDVEVLARALYRFGLIFTGSPTSCNGSRGPKNSFRTGFPGGAGGFRRGNNRLVCAVTVNDMTPVKDMTGVVSSIGGRIRLITQDSDISANLLYTVCR